MWKTPTHTYPWVTVRLFLRAWYHGPGTGRNQIALWEIIIVGDLGSPGTLYKKELSPQGCHSNLKRGLKGKTSLWRLPPSPLLRHLTPGRPDILTGEHSWLKAVLTLQTQACVGAAALRWQSPWLDVNGSFVWRLWLSQGHLVIRAARLINPRGIYFIYSPHSSFKVKV